VRAVLRAVVFLVAIVFSPCILMSPCARSECACINNASLFADFAVAHGKSIIFLVGDAGDPQQISRSCHHQVQMTVTLAARRSSQGDSALAHAENLLAANVCNWHIADYFRRLAECLLSGAKQTLFAAVDHVCF
jgi:hypothetical protein